MTSAHVHDVSISISVSIWLLNSRVGYKHSFESLNYFYNPWRNLYKQNPNTRLTFLFEKLRKEKAYVEHVRVYTSVLVELKDVLQGPWN